MVRKRIKPKSFQLGKKEKIMYFKACKIARYLDNLPPLVEDFIKKKQRRNIVEALINNWEYVLIGILAVDKAVALSPTKWDDLIWTSIRKAIFKVVGK